MIVLNERQYFTRPPIIPVHLGVASDYTYELVSGEIPEGSELANDSGEFRGSPHVSGQFQFSVQGTHITTGESIFADVEVFVVAVDELSYSLLDQVIELQQNQFESHEPSVPEYAGTADDYSNFTVESGTLPTGMTIDSATGVFSGTPTLIENGEVEVSATRDSDSQVIEGMLRYQVVATPTVIDFWYVAENHNLIRTCNNQFSIFRIQIRDSLLAGVDERDFGNFTLISGGLPTGLSVDPTDGSISGTPTGSIYIRATVRGELLPTQSPPVYIYCTVYVETYPCEASSGAMGGL